MTDDVTIERLGTQGDGVAEGGQLYVPLTLPDERVRVRRYGPRAQALRVLTPSAERAVPVCRHFGHCGGCALQHASNDFISGWKRDLIRTTLATRGIEGIEVRPVLTSPAGRRRRITVSARRRKSGAVIGFHGAGSDAIVPVEECPVADPSLVEMIPRLEELVLAAASRKGEVRITLTASEGGVDCAISGAKPVDGPARALLAGTANRAGVARLAWNGEVVLTRRVPEQQFGSARVTPPPGGFLQATPEGEAALVDAVTEIVGPARRVLDLFSGAGTFALPLAATAEVHAVEADGAALKALDAGWRATPGLRKITCEKRDLFALPVRSGGHGGGEMKGVEAVVMDPPRAGAVAQTRQLASSAVPRIAYVSCNPATFARDARHLIDGGYSLDWIQPVDQFRWSPHVELVGQFARD